MSSNNSLKNFGRSCTPPPIPGCPSDVPSSDEDMLCTPFAVCPLLEGDPFTQVVWSSLKKIKTLVVPSDSSKLVLESPPSKDVGKGFGVLFQSPLAESGNVSGLKKNVDQSGPRDFEWVKRMNMGKNTQVGLLLLVLRPLLKKIPVMCRLWLCHPLLGRFWSPFSGFQLFFRILRPFLVPSEITWRLYLHGTGLG